MACPEGFPNDGHAWRRIRRWQRGGIPVAGLYPAQCEVCGQWHIRANKKWRNRVEKRQGGNQCT